MTSTRKLGRRLATASLFSILVPLEIAQAQDGLSVGTVRTAAKQQAIRIVGDYLKEIPDAYFDASARPKATGDAGWWFLAYPEAKLLTGEKDAFQGLVAKATATYARFHAKELAPGVWVVDMDRTMWTFPMSVGAESDGAFRKVNALAEAGIVPVTSGTFGSQAYYIGLFGQAGYKFAGADSAGASAAPDQSKEPVNSALARAKLDGRINVPITLSSQLTVKLVGKGTLWYDVVNSATYGRLEGSLRIPLTPKESFDLTFERGSGAPNFTQGNQFSANLRMAF